MLEGRIALLRVHIGHWGWLAMLYSGWYRSCLPREKTALRVLCWYSYLVFLRLVISFAPDTGGGTHPAFGGSFWEQKQKMRVARGRGT